MALAGHLVSTMESGKKIFFGLGRRLAFLYGNSPGNTGAQPSLPCPKEEKTHIYSLNRNAKTGSQKSFLFQAINFLNTNINSRNNSSK